MNYGLLESDGRGKVLNSSYGMATNSQLTRYLQKTTTDYTIQFMNWLRFR